LVTIGDLLDGIPLVDALLDPIAPPWPHAPLEARPAGAAGCHAESMKTILNILWLVLCGFWLAIGYVAAGVLMCILIITIPFGIASFRLAAYSLWPFGRTVVPKPGAGVGSVIGNVLWFVLAGLWMAIAHLITGVALCVTIIGIPLGVADFKLAAVAVAPLGKDIVRTDDPRALR